MSRRDEMSRRRASRGDPAAMRAVARAKFAEGRWRDVTLGELEALVADREARIMGPGGPRWIEASRDDFGMPQESKDVCLRAPSAPPLPGFVPLPGAWILDSTFFDVASRRGGPVDEGRRRPATQGERWFPPIDASGDEGEEGRWGQIYMFGAQHHAQLIKVEDDDDGAQQPVGDPHGRYEDVLNISGGSDCATVRIPGLPGEWVLEIHPHEA